MYCGFITTLKNVRKHPNADRLMLAECYDNTVCVGLNSAEGEIGVYFPTDGQLSEEFCKQHDLVRRKDENGNPAGGYLDPEKRNIKAVKLRGEKSDGLFMPLSCLAYTGINLDDLDIGTQITVVNGHEICQKYIPKSNSRSARSGGEAGNRTRKHKENSYPFFMEHIDTPQLRFNMSMFRPGDYICLTEKVHGTSSRNANALRQRYKQNIFDKIFHKPGKLVSDYVNTTGTRRTIVEEEQGGYYGNNMFRQYWSKKFEGKLYPGECVFGEIAGFYEINAPIMPSCDNKKTKDKDFILQYGKSTTFSYGCLPDGENQTDKPLNRYFIYRMTYTSPDGYVIEYPWDLVKSRAEQMGFETVPELSRFIYTTEEDFINRINTYLDIPSTIDSKHIIEGVVVRAINSPGFKVAKEKSYNFKVLEGIIKTEAENPDMEEEQENL